MPQNYAATYAKRIFLALSVGFFPGVSHADSTCDALFEALRQFTKANAAKRHVNVYWTTNYYAGGARFMGLTEIVLRIRGETLQDLVGSGTRIRKFDSAYTNKGVGGGDEVVSLRIRLDGKVTFNDQYGPFDPACPGSSVVATGRAYAVIHTEASFEVFNFRFGYD